MNNADAKNMDVWTKRLDITAVFVIGFCFGMAVMCLVVAMSGWCFQ